MSEGTALLVIDMQVGLVAGAYRAGEVLVSRRVNSLAIPVIA